MTTSLSYFNQTDVLIRVSPNSEHFASETETKHMFVAFTVAKD